MTTAQDYDVTFGYGEYDGTYYTEQSPHRGNDRPTPVGTPIVIGDTTIGLTGSTGKVSGPHLHTQAGKDKGCQITLDPTPYEFKGGTVLTTGNASQWGNYIIIEVEPGSRYICYAHLSEIMVTQGQILKGEDMAEQFGSKEELAWTHRLLYNKEPTEKWLTDTFNSKASYKEITESMKKYAMDSGIAYPLFAEKNQKQTTEIELKPGIYKVS